MTLEGAINFNETNDYIIYTMNSATTGQYGVVLPKNTVNTLNMLIDLHMKDSFDGVSSGTKTKEQLVQEISDEYLKLKTKYNNAMLVMPVIDSNVYKNAVINSDKQKMFDIEKGIAAITSELYKKLIESGVDKQKIDQKIIIVEKTAEDNNYINWLKEQMPNPNFVEGVKLEEKTEEIFNPFMPTNDIFGAPINNNEVKVESPAATASSTNIFDAQAVQPVAPEVTPVVPVESVANENIPTGIVNSEVPGGNVDIFGTPLNQTNIQPEPPVVPVTQPTEVFATNTNVAPVQTPVEPVVSTPQPSVEAPKPVESAPLEGTMTFSTIANPTVNDVNSTNSETDSSNNVIENKSKGFANLLILLVILVGVTLASIELGKFLYSVYGA